jgi:hypothetical protein
MTDLNELDRFEKELRTLVHERSNNRNLQMNNNVKPRQSGTVTQTTINEDDTDEDDTDEDDKPHSYYVNMYNLLNKTAPTLMVVAEHGRPFTKISATRMAITEHGKPHNLINVTKMAVNEHGKPYVNVTMPSDNDYMLLKYSNPSYEGLKDEKSQFSAYK